MMNHLATLQGVASSSLVYHQVDNDTAQASQPEEIAP
jgi:nitrate reductase NapAB chaperone NapD